MTDRRRNGLIGLFVLFGLICLAVLVIKFGEAGRFMSRGYIVLAKFDRVSGVREGAEVQLAGVPAGSVLGIDLSKVDDPGAGVVVKMEIGRKFSVPRDWKATVSMPLMGQAVINIMPPDAPPGVVSEPVSRDGNGLIGGVVKNPLEQVMDPKFMATMEKTTAQIGDLAGALKPAADDLHILLQQRTATQVDTAEASGQRLTANLFTAVDRLHSVLKHIDTVIGDPSVQGSLKDTLANFKTASEDAKVAVAGFKQFSAEAQKTAVVAQGVVTKLDTTVEMTNKHIDELGRKLIENSDRLAKLLDYLVVAGRDVAEGNGTVGLLLRDPKFYEELMLTTRRLGAAAADLQVLVKQWQKDGILGMR